MNLCTLWAFALTAGINIHAVLIQNHPIQNFLTLGIIILSMMNGHRRSGAPRFVWFESLGPNRSVVVFDHKCCCHELTLSHQQHKSTPGTRNSWGHKFINCPRKPMGAEDTYAPSTHKLTTLSESQQQHGGGYSQGDGNFDKLPNRPSQ